MATKTLADLLALEPKKERGLRALDGQTVTIEDVYARDANGYVKLAGHGEYQIPTRLYNRLSAVWEKAKAGDPTLVVTARVVAGEKRGARLE